MEGWNDGRMEYWNAGGEGKKFRFGFMAAGFKLQVAGLKFQVMQFP